MDPAVELGLGLGPELDMVKVREGEPEVGGEPEQSEEELECGLRGGLTRERRGGGSRRIRN